MSDYDLVIAGGNVVIPNDGLRKLDLGIKGGKIATVAKEIPLSNTKEVIEAKNKFVFPGALDSHFHVGIFRPYKDDAVSETASAASGGVTTILSYFRQGKDYLGKIGPWKEIFPELLSVSKDSFVVDYGYHLSMFTDEHLSEMEWLVKDCGVSTFKYHTFFKLLDVTGTSSEEAKERDFGFLYKYMKEVNRLNEMFKENGKITLSVHCENPEIVRVTMEEVKKSPSGNLVRDHSNARPPLDEELAINEVGVIANYTNCPINFLHLSSRRAIDAAKDVASRYPQLNFLLEVTLHHLGLSDDMDLGGHLAKVYPPIRSKEDVNYLWKSVVDGSVQTVVSDHACITKELKMGDLWTCRPGFGGTALMFPILITEGYHKRNLSLRRIAELTSYNPAVFHNVYPKKGAIMVGSDADFAILDIDEEKEVRLETLHTAQDFCPAEGLKLKGWPKCTILRGKVIFENGEVIGEPGYGEYIKRPVKRFYSDY